MKTITLSGGLELELTDERKGRITQALIETQDKLDKELAYSEDLQKAETVAFYRSHIKRLAAMLS